MYEICLTLSRQLMQMQTKLMLSVNGREKRTKYVRQQLVIISYLQMNFCRFDIFGCFVRNVFADIERMPPAENRNKYMNIIG